MQDDGQSIALCATVASRSSRHATTLTNSLLYQSLCRESASLVHVDIISRNIELALTRPSIVARCKQGSSVALTRPSIVAAVN